MSLTVPEAGLTAGRAAQPQYEAPRTGEAIAGFGEAIKGLGDRIEKQRLDLEWGRAQLDMTRDLNNLRLKYEQMGDPEAINNGWATDVAALKQSYLTGKTDAGGARIDAKIAPQFDLAFDDLAQKHAFALGSNVIALRHNQTIAANVVYRAETAKQAATTDASTRTTIYDQYAARQRQMAKDGLIPYDQAERDILDFKSGGDGNAAFQMLSTDPQGLIDHLDAGELPNLTPEDRLSWKAKAENQITIAAGKAAKAAEVQAGIDDNALQDDLKNGIALMGKGLAWDGEAKLKDPTVRARFPDLVAQATDTQALRDEHAPILLMTREQLVTAITDAKSRPYSKDYQGKRVETLEARLKDYDTAWTKDQVAAARAAELPVPDLAPFDPANPAAFAKSLADRASFGAWAEGKGYVPKGQMRLMSDAEAADLKPAIAPTAEPATRLAAATALASLPDGKGDGVAVAAGATPAFLFGMGLIGENADPSLVTSMLRGEAKLDAKTVAMPADKDLILAFNTATQGIFADDPGAQKEVMAAAGALYADQATGLDPETIKAGGWTDSVAAQDAYGQAVQRALGGSVDTAGNMTIGGLQDVAGYPVILPTGMSAGQANTAWNGMQHQLNGEVWVPAENAWLPAGARMSTDGKNMLVRAPAAEAAIDRMRGLKAAAVVKGMVPDSGKTNVATVENLRPLRIGPDRYVLAFDRAGARYYVENEGGAKNADGTTTFMFSMKGLAGATGQ